MIEKLVSLLLETSPDEISEEQRDQYQEFILQLQDLLRKKYNEATQNLLKVSEIYCFKVVICAHKLNSKCPLMMLGFVWS